MAASFVSPLPYLFSNDDHSLPLLQGKMQLLGCNLQPEWFRIRNGSEVSPNFEKCVSIGFCFRMISHILAEIWDFIWILFCKNWKVSWFGQIQAGSEFPEFFTLYIKKIFYRFYIHHINYMEIICRLYNLAKARTREYLHASIRRHKFRSKINNGLNKQNSEFRHCYSLENARISR